MCRMKFFLTVFNDILVFGEQESPDIPGHIEPPTDLTEVEIMDLCGKERGIQVCTVKLL